MQGYINKIGCNFIHHLNSCNSEELNNIEKLLLRIGYRSFMSKIEKMNTSKDHAEVYRTVYIEGLPLYSLLVDGKERLCLSQISATLLKDFTYNDIHNRRVALGITCVQCSPAQLELLRKIGAIPPTSRRCGMITIREAERLCKSFLSFIPPPALPEEYAFDVYHNYSWGCVGKFFPRLYTNSRAKCIKCDYCHKFHSPNKFIFHVHRTEGSTYTHPRSGNYNCWRRHLFLNVTNTNDKLLEQWEDLKALYNGNGKKRGASSKSIPVSNASKSMKYHGGHELVHPQIKKRGRPCLARIDGNNNIPMASKFIIPDSVSGIKHSPMGKYCKFSANLVIFT